MKIAKGLVFNEQADLKEQVRQLDFELSKLFEMAKGRIRFGTASDGYRGENIAGEFQVVADTGTANTEFTVAHTLGAIPVGFLVINIDKGGVVYDSGTTWTSSNIYFKCSTANTAVTLFLLK